MRVASGVPLSMPNLARLGLASIRPVAGVAPAADVDAATVGWVRMQVLKLSDLLTARFFVQGNVSGQR